MTSVEQISDQVLSQTHGDRHTLRAVIARLDRELAAAPLERTMAVWDISASQLAHVFGVSRQAMSKWLQHGPPSNRRHDVALLQQSTDLLERWVKRERIPAVVRRDVDALHGRSRLDVALDGDLELLRDELYDTFDLTRIAP